MRGAAKNVEIAQRIRHALVTTAMALGLIVGSASSFLGLGGAEAQIQFGPTGNGPGNTAAGTYDREFVREWESNPPKGFATLAKANVAATKEAIKRYTEIVDRGGWPQIPEPEGKVSRDKLMQYGITNAAVSLLGASGLPLRAISAGGNTSSTYFDYDVEKALQRFQASNGLTPTGIADKRTIVALNVPADARLKQLKVNLVRLQEVVPTTSRKYVVVNIPAAQIEAVHNGQSSRATPASSAKLIARRPCCTRRSRT